MCGGKSFHMDAPATGKARHPTVESLTAMALQQHLMPLKGKGRALAIAPLSN